MTMPEALPLPPNAKFKDLVFRPHTDGIAGHTHALHTLADGRHFSVTRGGHNYGTPDAPYEAQDHEHEIHAPLTSGDIDRLLEKLQG